MKGKDLHPTSLYTAKLSFRMKGRIKCFRDKVKFKEFIIIKPLLYELLSDLSKKKMIKPMNSEMTTDLQLLTTEPKKQQKLKQ